MVNLRKLCLCGSKLPIDPLKIELTKTWRCLGFHVTKADWEKSGQVSSGRTIGMKVPQKYCLLLVIVSAN